VSVGRTLGLEYELGVAKIIDNLTLEAQKFLRLVPRLHTCVCVCGVRVRVMMVSSRISYAYNSINILEWAFYIYNIVAYSRDARGVRTLQPLAAGHDVYHEHGQWQHQRLTFEL
jgi:hypothetical protein